MTDQNTFMETINSVAEIIRTSEIPLSREEIISYFADMELDDDQKEMVLEYLMNSQTESEADLLEEGNCGEFQKEEDSTRSAVFKMYLEELSYLPVYSRAEEEKLYEALLEGDDSVIKKLSDCWLKKVLSIAQKYVEPKLNVEDLIQEGNMALFLTLKKLCGCKEKVDVKGILKESIESGMMSYASEINGERDLENAILGKVSLIQQAKKLLTEENGQEPTIKELADYTKMQVEELNDLMDMIKTADA